MRSATPSETTAPSLSRREREVLEILGRGEIDKAAAQELGISLGTVRVYRKRIQEKLGTHGLVQSLLVAGRLGQIDLEALTDEAMAAAAAKRVRGPRPPEEDEPAEDTS